MLTIEDIDEVASWLDSSPVCQSKARWCQAPPHEADIVIKQHCPGCQDTKTGPICWMAWNLMMLSELVTRCPECSTITPASELLSIIRRLR